MAEGQTLVEVDPDICELEYERYLTLQRARRKLRASLMWLKLRRGEAGGEGGDGVGGGGGETKASQDDPQVMAKLQALAKQVRDITSTSTGVGVWVCVWVWVCARVHHACARYLIFSASMPFFRSAKFCIIKNFSVPRPPHPPISVYSLPSHAADRDNVVHESDHLKEQLRSLTARSDAIGRERLDLITQVEALRAELKRTVGGEHA